MPPRFIAPVLALTTTACIGMIPGAQPGSTAPDPAQQRAAMAESMGHPTKKSSEDLERTIEEQTKTFKPTGRSGEFRLETPEPFVFEGVSGTCYKVVMRLGDGATWGLGAEAGLRFDFQRPETAGSGGPGVVGPGAVASIGCAETTGNITLTMAPMFGQDPIGQGPIKMQLFSHAMTRAEKKQYEQDKQQQIAEQREHAAREAERQAERDERSRQEREDRQAADRESSRSSSRSGSTGSSSSSSGPVSVTIRSSCSKTVPVFYGTTPKFGSGTSSSVSSNSVSSKSFRVGDMMWVVDQSGNGLDSVTISESTRTLEITSSCSSISSR